MCVTGVSKQLEDDVLRAFYILRRLPALGFRYLQANEATPEVLLDSEVA